MTSETTKHLVLGTAGHVDHGKTSLIKAMTGINPDRLKEEQERGLTIDLGFAHLMLPSGIQLGIIDVPGHERFLKNMLAGASGVDIALLVIAADEGVMPQTREHLEILELLETRNGLIAITKTDLVDEQWLEIVEDDIRSSLEDSFLRNARMIRISSVTGQGVEALVGALDELAREAVQRTIDGPFRMPVDRVFTITGFGTVVTGTLVSGTMRVADPLKVLPEGLDSRVRQIQVHGTKQDAAYAGTRVAVNLAGVDVDDLGRGSVLLPPGYLQAATSLDAWISVLHDAPRPLRNRTRIRLHVGSAEAIGRAMVLGTDEIAPGDKGFVQFRLERPVVAARGDRFVARFYSPTNLVGGGVILDPASKKHKKGDAAVIKRLEHALKGDPADIVRDALLMSETGLTKAEVARRTGIADRVVAEAVTSLVADGEVIEHAGRCIARAALEAVSARVASILESYHKSNPVKPGMPKEELRAQLGQKVDQKGFQAIMGLMASEGRIVASEATVRLPQHKPTLGARQEQLAAGIEGDYRAAGVNPPLANEIERKYGPGAGDIVAMLVDRGKLVRIAPELLLHAETLEKTETALRAYLKEHPQMTVAEFRDLIGSSRKYVVPLLEYFDAKKVTRRSGDLRSLY